LYTDEAIKLLNEKFACFAPGWFINSDDPVYKEAWQRFYLAKARPTEGSGWVKATQLVVMTSAGRLLEGNAYDSKTGKVDLARGLTQVLESYASLPEAERRPAVVQGEEKPVPPPPEGGLVLTIYDRLLGCTAEGDCRLPEGNDLDGVRTHAPAGQRSSLWLTAEECKSLIPADPRIGKPHEVPAKLARRICLYGLWPQTLWVVEHTWQPDSVREAQLELTPLEVTPQAFKLRIHGSVLLSVPSRLKRYPTSEFVKDLENRYDARLEGIMLVDRAKQRITQWDMVALGDYSGAMFTHREESGRNVGEDGWREATRAAPVPLAFAFELDQTAYDTPPERRRPRSFVQAYIFRDREPFYWDPDKWEEDWKRRQRQ
jgi:hypothetical protein